jgi:hypothetical protein
MADNATGTDNAGQPVTFAGDDIGGVIYLRSKVALGPDGAATDWGLGRLAAAGSAPVVLSSEDLAAVAAGPASSALSEVNGAITTGGVDQQALAANGARRVLLFQNCSDASMTLSLAGGTPDATSGLVLAPGEGLQFTGAACPTGAIRVWGATAGKRFWAAQG